MLEPISIFVLDVKNSSQFEDPDELTEYLDEVVKAIQAWCSGVVISKVRARKGDEIIFVAEQFVSAYLVARYVDAFWRYPEHPPYFGVGCGLMDKNILSIVDVDVWNHPHMKKVSRALERAKELNRRMVFEIFHPHREIDLRNLNTLAEAEEAVTFGQTRHQRIACDLKSLWPIQKDVAGLLRKTEATVSDQLKKGGCATVHSIADTLIENLIDMQEAESITYSVYRYDPLHVVERLKHSIRDYLYDWRLVPQIVNWRTRKD